MDINDAVPEALLEQNAIAEALAKEDGYLSLLAMPVDRRKVYARAAKAVLAAIPDGLADEAFVEGPSYYRRLRMYRGELAPEDLLSPDKGSQVIHDVETIYATQGYGVGNWYLYNGETERARAVFEQILQGRSRFAFGYIAAELDLREMAEG